MPATAHATVGRYACVSGQKDGSLPQELTLHEEQSGARNHVCPPQGRIWRDVVAVGNEMVVAAATTAEPLAPLEIYAFTAGPSGWDEPACRALPVPPIPSAHPYAMAVTADDTHVLLIADLGQTERREHLFAVPTADAAPTRVWPLSPDVQVSSLAAAPDDHVVLTASGLHQHPQHRQILRCPLTDQPLLAHHTVLAQERHKGVHQIWTADLSPDGNQLAIVHTSDEGALFTVSVTDLEQDRTRVVWQQPCSTDDPTTVHVSFNRTGRHLLFSYGDLIAIDLTDHTHRVLASPGQDRWLLATA